nr:MAG: capsid protein [Crogonang virus 112]
MPSQKRKRIPSNPNPNPWSRKKSRVTASANVIPRSLKAFPKSMRVKLKYNSIFDGSIVSGSTPTQYNWRANSVFDPDAAVGGGQPRGFSQWSNFYEKYHVVKSSCRLRLLDKDTGTSGTGTVTGLYGIALRDGSAATTVRELTEDDGSKYSGYDSWHAASSITLYFDAAKHWGSANILDNDHLGGTTGTTLGSNPIDQAYFMTWASQAPSSGAAAQPFLWDVMLEYDVIFTDPKDLST